MFPNPINMTTVPTINSQTGVVANSYATYTICCKSLEFSIYGGTLRRIIEYSRSRKVYLLAQYIKFFDPLKLIIS